MNKYATVSLVVLAALVAIIGVYGGLWWALFAGLFAFVVAFMASACRLAGEYDEVTEQELQDFIEQERMK